MPILSDWFHDKVNHKTLLIEESILCYAILTVSSRFLVLPGYSGRSRGYLLHDHFFKYVQRGIQGLLWGCPLGRGNGMTSVGAIESLVLLTQWVRYDPCSVGIPFAYPTIFSNRAGYICRRLFSICHGQLQLKMDSSGLVMINMVCCFDMIQMRINRNSTRKISQAHPP